MLLTADWLVRNTHCLLVHCLHDLAPRTLCLLPTADCRLLTTYYILLQRLDDLGVYTERLRSEAVVAIFDEAQEGGQHLGGLAGSSK